MVFNTVVKRVVPNKYTGFNFLILYILLQTHGTISRTWITSSQGYPFKLQYS